MAKSPSLPEVAEAPTLADQVNTVKDAVVEQLGDAAQRLKAISPKTGALAQLGKGLQTRLTRSEDYLRDRTAADLVSDLISLVRRRPLPFVLGALGVGIGLVASQKSAPVHHAARPPAPKKRPAPRRPAPSTHGTIVTH